MRRASAGAWNANSRSGQRRRGRETLAGLRRFYRLNPQRKLEHIRPARLEGAWRRGLFRRLLLPRFDLALQPYPLGQLAQVGAPASGLALRRRRACHRRHGRRGCSRRPASPCWPRARESARGDRVLQRELGVHVQRAEVEVVRIATGHGRHAAGRTGAPQPRATAERARNSPRAVFPSLMSPSSARATGLLQVDPVNLDQLAASWSSLTESKSARQEQVHCFVEYSRRADISARATPRSVHCCPPPRPVPGAP